MAKSPETKFCTQSYPRKVIHIREHFRRSRQNSTVSKKLRTGRRLLKKILVSYEQKNKFDAKLLREITLKIWIWENYSSDGKTMDVTKLCLCDGVSFLLHAVTESVFNKASGLYSNSLLW